VRGALRSVVHAGVMQIDESARQVTVAGSHDVIVAGGGPAGVAAAIAAAQAGANVLLIEASGALGGVWTGGLLTYVLDAGNKTGGVMAGLLDRLRRAEGRPVCTDQAHDLPWVTGSWYFDPETMRAELESWCGELGITVLYHSRVVAAQVAGRRVTHVLSEGPGGRLAWAARACVDATGNGDLGALAGCAFAMGRGEDGQVQPLSLLALVGGVDPAAIAPFVHGAPGSGGEPGRRLLAALRSAGADPSYGHPVLFPAGPGLWSLMANHEYGIRCDDALGLSRATVAARREVHALVAALRSLGGAWSGLRVVATASQIGIREGRRLAGRYTLTADDLACGARFVDAVCRVNFPVDIHALDPRRDKGFSDGGVRAQPYDIPLRALQSAAHDNLAFAGRCISGDFVAHASYRVTGNAVPMGEAAGRWAAG
jgi:hypothetical protein